MGYEESWDYPHTVGPEENWQESDCYWWLDAEARIGGWHRIGWYPNQKIGQSSIFLYEMGGDRFLDRNIEISADQCARAEAHQVVGLSKISMLAPLRPAFEYKGVDAEVSLIFEESFYTPRDWISGAKTAYDLQSETGHLEVSGRLRGTLRIADRVFDVNALAHRDRSWGPRNLVGFDVLWFCNGTTGPQLSWAAMDIRLAGGHRRTVGFVVREGRSEELISCGVNVLTAADGVTPLRAFMTLETPSESLNLEIETVQGFMQRIAPGPFIVTNQSSLIRVDGQVGFGDFGVVQNALRGSYIPMAAELRLTCVEDGLSPFVDHRSVLLPTVRSLLEKNHV
ncbi:hypothetical protein [Castellaniella sp. GW247-6E4]|uniref:DUF7065 domain-containing protein n=1 Tax=Castellaniella sp. GW247-6E4 TaxID=3140380 RepID=UPI003315BDEE